jgi:unsaturated chondroitin disaccharide hydrolase
MRSPWPTTVLAVAVAAVAVSAGLAADAAVPARGATADASRFAAGPVRALPQEPALSFTLRAPAALNAGGRTLALPASRVEVLRRGGRRLVNAGWRRHGTLPASGRLRLRGGVARDVVATSTAPELLLVHRLAALRDVTPRGRVPRGTDRRGKVRLTRDWMIGFWPGALWHAYDVAGHPPLLRTWALQATRDVLGNEDEDSHDVGMIASRSALAAWERLCAGGASTATCEALRESALRSAGTLRRLIGTNAAAGTLPMRSVGTCTSACEDRPEQADTIIDSVMNVEPLWWEAAHGGGADGPALARRHLDGVADLLLRPDGSAFQSVHLDRATGAVVERHTHQGITTASRWARGQAWALYGYAQAAEALGDPRDVERAQRIAAMWERSVPAGLPRWDLDARDGPVDASAAAIAAAGAARLGDTALARRLLRPVLARVGRGAPLGRLASQVYTYGGSNWDENAEFLIGIDFALEAAALLSAR